MKILAGLLSVDKLKKTHTSKRGNVFDSKGTEYNIGEDGVIRRVPPKVRMSKKNRLKLRRENDFTTNNKPL